MKITKLLVANRGEIASRVFRTCRELDIATVAVFSDADASAPFVGEADEAVALSGNSAAETYLRADLVIAAALRTGANAIHPGYGFLSENAEFAEACADAGIVFVGPPPAAIRSMGSKTAAKELMQAAGVPVLSGITIGDGESADGLADRAAKEVGYPVLVKAAFGGGGRGMRVVHDPVELEEAVASARREATSAFGNGTVFLERFVDRPRHIEVQVFADTQGHAVHLFERECSIQRRYQKVIEEAPSPVVTPAMRTELGSAAVAAAKAIGYVGAGTVEFIMDSSGDFFFLEVNTRLQVEHPVTEMITGLDLVALQLSVAEGEPLPPAALEATITGHAIEARLCAEDPTNGYLPGTGRLLLFDVPDLPGVRLDTGVRTGSEVSAHYDNMLAKVIAYAPTRDQAARLLARALSEARILGVVTNRDLLVGVLREDEFRAGDIDTGYLTRHDPAELSKGSDETVPVHALAVALADAAERRASSDVLPAAPTGWRNVRNAPSNTVLVLGDEPLEVQYRLRGTSVEATVGGAALDGVVLRACTPDEVDLQVAGVRRVVSVARSGSARYADSVLGATAFAEQERFPLPGALAVAGSLIAPMNGTVIRVEAEVGQVVTAGTVIVVLEAMKMEHVVKAPHDGTITVLDATVGGAVDLGHVLAVVSEADEPAEAP
ncbi:MAG: carbamoyl-phosphate synthase subunit [Frankiales bacterium]|jgi:propionyl-CoA carboxylase alpha chain|nr:carbamoyl-phosphate synthase subunit [Frankiales bacterium]